MKVIAIDAGASKTRVILKDTAKPTIHKEIILQPCNYFIQAKKGIKKLVEEILFQYNIKNAEPYHLLAGFAGVVIEDSKKQISRIFQSYGFSQHMTFIFSDAELLLEAIGNNGIVLIAGTGAICIGKKTNQDIEKYEQSKIGGYGYRFNTEPGGYSLGLKAIQKCLEFEDGIIKVRSILMDAIKYHYKVKEIRKLIPAIYKSKEFQKEIAELSSVIFQCASQHDLISLSLLREHTEILASYIRTIYRNLEYDKTTVYLHGGLFKNRYSKEFLINPIMNHKSLKNLNIKFKTLGVKKSDIDPLVELLKRFHN